MNISKYLFRATFFALAILLLIEGRPAFAASRTEMERDARTALSNLYATSPGARALSQKALAILVFPAITKGGLIIGGQYGDGVLFQDGKKPKYYNTTAASYGLQAGVQTFGYALFFMKQENLSYLVESDGWELGTGPSIVVADEAMATSFSSTTMREGIYAFFFKQQGLMAGLGLQGTKITEIHPNA